MSIPDIEILKNYELTMDCGHTRRTSAPCTIGTELPCLNDSHKMELHTVAKITHSSGRDVKSIGWLTPQAAMLGAYDELRDDADSLPWYRWIKRRKLRSEAHVVGLAARIGSHKI